MKRIKKPLILLLALCLISGMAILPARADHTHAYDGPWVTDLEPSCTAAGRRYTVCTAADCTVPPYTLTDALPALGRLGSGHAGRLPDDRHIGAHLRPLRGR